MNGSTNSGGGVQTLFSAALERPPEERASFLASSGSDPEIVAEVIALLDAHEGRGRLDSLLGKLRTLRSGPSPPSPSLEFITSQLRGSLSERYRIERELGRGGMAIVMLAEDLKHRRKVALKILKPELAHDVGTARFLQEIATVAGLAHPNILPLHDSGEADGLLYYVMPFVAGESLRDKIRRDGRMKVADALRVAREVADGLRYAHEHGIVHRDIKPENVLLVAGHAVVSDFGIARAMQAAGGHEVAEAAIAMGTPAYMSPEQIRGDPTLDGRSDIYSLGCVLFEMLSGSAPFRGTVESVIQQHLESPPPRLTAAPVVARIVRQAMEKRAADRFQSAEELDAALNDAASARLRIDRRTAFGLAIVVPLLFAAVALWNRFGPAPAISTKPLVMAIRPFVQLGANDSTGFGWLAAALESRLADALFDAPEIELRSTATVAAFASRRIPDDSLARVLNVDFFLDGQLVRSGDSIGATVQLIDARRAAVLEVGTVRQALGSPSEQLLDAIASKVALALLPAVGREVRLRQWTARTRDTLAVRLRHRAQERRWAGEALISADPGAAAREFAEADSLLAASAARDRRWHEPRLARAELASRRALAEVRQSADKSVVRGVLDEGITSAEAVLREDASSAEGLAYRGRLRWRKYLWGVTENRSPLLDSAESDLRRAASAERPVAAAAQDMSEILYMERSQFAEAREFALRAYRLDAYLDGAGLLINRIALSSLNLGSDVDAANWCRTGLRRYPEEPFHVACMLEVMAWGTAAAVPDSAQAYYRTLTSRDPSANVRWHYLLRVAAVHARAGQRANAEQLLAQVRREVSEASADGRRLLPWEAGVHYRLGNDAEGERLYEQYRAFAPGDAEIRRNGYPLRGFVRPRTERPTG